MMMSQLIALVFVTSAIHPMPRFTGVGALDGCDAGCRCKADGILRTADCSDLGLTDTPSNINVLTTYLDLSMNDFTTLPAGAFSRFTALRELRLAGNKLNTLPKHAFTGLVQLQVLTLQNNHLSQVPTESLKNLRNLRSLRLDANALSTAPRGSFRGLGSLRYLWMDDNRLTQVPAAALAGLPSLQALTLALNHISHLPDLAFHALRHLLVLHLHNNQIASLAQRCFDGLQDLETLDLSSNRLDSFPTVIRALPSLRDLNLHSNNIQSIPEHAFTGNPSLETINLHNNPVRSIGKTSFQNLPELLTLSLSGTSSITRFPDLTGTSRVETLSITGTHVSELPSTLCEILPDLQQLDLSHNHILSLPCFTHCRKIQKIDLRHNFIHEIQTGTFRKMSELLSLDLSFNRLSHLPLREELSGLTRLSVAGNQELRGLLPPRLLPPHLLPRLRLAEMPCGPQGCVLTCVRPGPPCPICPCRTDNGDCALRGSTGPEVRPPQHHRMESRTRPAHHLLAPALFLQIPLSSPPPWAAHFCVWAIFIPSMGLNCLVLTLVLLPAAACRTTPARRLLLAALFCLRLLTGLCGAVLVLAEDLQSPADLPAPQAPCWGGEAPRRRGSVGELAVLLSSQACVVVLMTAVVWEHRELRPAAPGARRLAGAASPVLVAVVLGCSAALALLACARPGRTHPWEHSAGRVALNCGGYLLLTAVHLLLLCGRRRDESSARRPRGVPATHGPTTHGPAVTPATHGRAVTGMLLANTLLAVAEALLWGSAGSAGSPATWPPGRLLQPAGGSPSLLLAALPAVLDPLLYTLLLLQQGDPRVGPPGDGKR